jgi:putative two-component system response regulator
MLAVADAYDAMVTDRPYRKAVSHEEAVAVISAEKGRQFDPEIVDVFLEISEKFYKVGCPCV